MAREIFQGPRLLAVLCGGFLGTIARYLLSLAIQGLVGKGWPVDILVINLVGAFVLALLSTLADAALFIGPRGRLFFNVGFLGAFTTFSSLALGTVTLAPSHFLLALLYIVCSLLGGILAVLLGQWCGRALVARARTTTALATHDAARVDDTLLSSGASRSSLEEEERTF